MNQLNYSQELERRIFSMQIQGEMYTENKYIKMCIPSLPCTSLIDLGFRDPQFTIESPIILDSLSGLSWSRSNTPIYKTYNNSLCRKLIFVVNIIHSFIMHQSKGCQQSPSNSDKQIKKMCIKKSKYIAGFYNSYKCINKQNQAKLTTKNKWNILHAQHFVRNILHAE